MDQDPINPLDQATADRLRRLSTMPMDLSRLQASLRAARKPSAPPTVILRLLRPASGLAASVAVLFLVAIFVLSNSPGEAMASPVQMAQLHRDLVAGRIHAMQVDSIDAAGRMLSQRDPKTPALPQPPDAHVMACCMKNVSDKRVACVLLKSEDAPITMSVANAADMKPVGNVFSRNGAQFHIVAYESLNMVSTEKAGRWVCLIGELPTDKLIAIAEKLQF
jgi:hypothetical protein